MPRRKKQEVVEEYNSLLSDKDILIAYCSTLSEAKCKKAYKLLKFEFNDDKGKMIRLNEHAVQDDTGLLRLHKRQLDKALQEFGKDMFEWLIARMYNYVLWLQEKGEQGDVSRKSKFKAFTRESIYPRLHDNWIIDEYLKQSGDNYKPIDFYSIKTEEQALQYVKELPAYLMDGCTTELEYLTAKYPKVLEYVRGLGNG